MENTETAVQAKEGDNVLWLNTLHGKADVEEGNVIIVDPNRTDTKYTVVWLEGHSSRNDDFGDDRLLAIYDRTAPHATMSVWSGRMRITPAGQKWLQENAAKS
jgi:hypothetical protein